MLIKIVPLIHLNYSRSAERRVDPGYPYRNVGHLWQSLHDWIYAEAAPHQADYIDWERRHRIDRSLL